jgi:hypothetical protein
MKQNLRILKLQLKNPAANPEESSRALKNSDKHIHATKKSTALENKKQGLYRSRK